MKHCNTVNKTVPTVGDLVSSDRRFNLGLVVKVLGDPKWVFDLTYNVIQIGCGDGGWDGDEYTLDHSDLTIVSSGRKKKE